MRNSVWKAMVYPIGFLLAAQESGFIQVSEGLGGKSAGFMSCGNASLSGSATKHEYYHAFLWRNCKDKIGILGK